MPATNLLSKIIVFISDHVSKAVWTVRSRWREKNHFDKRFMSGKYNSKRAWYKSIRFGYENKNIALCWLRERDNILEIMEWAKSNNTGSNFITLHQSLNYKKKISGGIIYCLPLKQLSSSFEIQKRFEENLLQMQEIKEKWSVVFYSIDLFLT